MKLPFLALIALFVGPSATMHAAEAPPVNPMIGALPAAKVLFLGNSITLHGPAPDIGWTGNWGMAASAGEKDYVHLLTAEIARAAGAPPQTMVRNIADFERGYDSFDVTTVLKPELEFGADIVIVAIGENVPRPATDAARARFAAAFARLLSAIQRRGHPIIFVRSSFWPDAIKDDIMREAGAEAGATFVDIAALGREEANAARSEQKIAHAGVAAHPGDRGMRAIADAIFATIAARAGKPTAQTLPQPRISRVEQVPQPLPVSDAASLGHWQIGEPIVTYWCGPSLTDAVAKQMAEGGFNVVWCSEKELDVAQRHGLRAQLTDGLLAPSSLDNPDQLEKLNRLIERVRNHPALYAYFLTDEPSAAQFPALGRLVAHLRERDPAHLAYINLFPTYASNAQLGTTGDVITAYREHLRQYTSVVKPALISYDHYQFEKTRDGTQYFLNLAMIRRAAQDADVPFLNIVQAASWAPHVRVPDTNELRYLVYTSVAYGAQGISYYIYTCANHEGGIARADGTPTPIYYALQSYDREFVAIDRELQPLRSLAVHHTMMNEPGCEPLPASAAFRVEDAQQADRARGFLLGTFGRMGKATHLVAVNLDYKNGAVATVVGPGDLEAFDALAGRWTNVGRSKIEIRLPPGGGKLLRVR